MTSLRRRTTRAFTKALGGSHLALPLASAAHARLSRAPYRAPSRSQPERERGCATRARCAASAPAGERDGEPVLPIANLGRTLRTVRHLRPSQIAHRLRYTLRRAWWERRADVVDARYRTRSEALGPFRWDHPGLAAVAAFRAERHEERDAIAIAEDALRGRFRFLGQLQDMGTPVEWLRADLDRGTRLWKTHLHEFSYAEELARAAVATSDPRYAERLFALARSWRDAAPIGCPGFAKDAWNARAVATRLVHWSVAGSHLGLDAAPDAEDAAWLAREIGLHGLFLRDNLELDLQGNHLFRDAVGLVFAQELAGGVTDGLDWLRAQVERQILPDGAHLERAPMYHGICLRDLIEVRLLLGGRGPDWLDAAISRMAGFLEAIALGDGEIPLQGDAWLGEIDTPSLLAAARSLGPLAPPQAPERHSGLVALAAGPWRAIVRAGPHGPDFMLGHAHADLLSFDASFGAARIVSDTGTHLYDPGPERQQIRATAAHNTLRLDGEEQLETWGSFRAGRRGRARAIARGRTGTWEWLSASHDAYHWLPGRPEPHRLVALGERGLLILDAVLGTGQHDIESFVHEHPDAETENVQILPLVTSAATRPAALHEHFGQTGSMRQHRQALRTALPWIGGWWIAPDARPEAIGSLSLDGGVLHLALREPRIGLSWRPGSTDEQEAVSLCSASGGSAN